MDSPHQKKRLSQVFLTTTLPCEQLSSLLEKEKVSHVLEIGPGKGILTKVLLDRGMTVTAVEKDPRFVDYLNKDLAHYISNEHLKIEKADILNYDISRWRQSHSEQRLSICGNIPYSISTPLLEALLPHLEFVQISALLVQLEFAERIASPPGQKSYGSLSIFAQLRSQVRVEFSVHRSLFTPIPKVDSAIVSLKYKKLEASPELLQFLEILTKAAFSQRRKKLSNALSKFIKEKDLRSLSLDFSLRPENLSPEDYLRLARFLQKNMS